MASRTEKPVEVEAEVIDEKGLTVSFTPAAIDANFDALDARVESMIADYVGARYDLTEPENVKQAKRDRSYLNGIVKEIDERRKAVKREYMRPLDDFEARANAITAKVKKASENIKEQLDEAERRRRDAAYAALEEYYEDLAGLLAPVVPYERIHDGQWLNKTFGEVKAKKAIEERVSRIAADWETLQTQRGLLPHYADAERVFFDTLDLGEALSAARAAQEKDDRIARMKSEIEEYGRPPAPAPDATPKAPPEPPEAVAPGPAPAPPAPEPEPAPAPPAPCPARGDEGPCAWVIVVPSATKAQMEHAAKNMRVYGVTGIIRKGTVAQVYAREQEVSNAR